MTGLLVLLRVCSATVQLKCVLLIQGQSIARPARHSTAQRSSARPWPQTVPRPTTNVMTTGSSNSSSTNSKRLAAFVVVLRLSCVCPGCPARCPSAQSRTCRPVGTAPNGAKVKVPQLERIKTNFTLFPTLPFCLVPFLAN